MRETILLSYLSGTFMGLRRAGPCLWESMEADVSATAGPPEVFVIIIPTTVRVLGEGVLFLSDHPLALHSSFLGLPCGCDFCVVWLHVTKKKVAAQGRGALWPSLWVE